MIKVEFAHFAQRAILEKDSNNLSIINIVTVFHTRAFPFIVPQLAFVMRTTRNLQEDPNEVEVDIVIKQEDSEILSHKAKVHYHDKDGNNLVININGMVVSKPSPVVITCLKDEQVLKELSIKVIQISPEIVEESTEQSEQ